MINYLLAFILHSQSFSKIVIFSLLIGRLLACGKKEPTIVLSHTTFFAFRPTLEEGFSKTDIENNNHLCERTNPFSLLWV